MVSVGDAEFPAYPSPIPRRCSWNNRPPVGTSSVVIDHRIVAASGTTCITTAMSSRCGMDRRDGKPTELPPGVRRALETLKKLIDTSPFA